MWKALGLAAFAGVAATGVVIVRAERRRRAYTPEEIRDRLHDRLTGTVVREYENGSPRRAAAG